MPSDTACLPQDPRPFGPATPLPATRLSRAAERLLRVSSAFMARHWPLLVAAIYLDCGRALLLRGPHDFAQIAWHLAAIALTHCLATLGSRSAGDISLHERPAPARARLEGVAGALLLPLLLALTAASCLDRAAHPLLLNAPVRILAGACSLLLALAVLTRLARLRAGFQPQPE